MSTAEPQVPQMPSRHGALSTQEHLYLTNSHNTQSWSDREDTICVWTKIEAHEENVSSVSPILVHFYLLPVNGLPE